MEDLEKGIENRCKKRQKRKEELDRMLSMNVLSNGKKTMDLSLNFDEEGQRVRLLDEGCIVNDKGDPVYVIRKESIKEFYNSLDEGSKKFILLGHVDEFSFPDRIIGEFTKQDLHLVEKEDGRYALDVDVRIDNDNIYIQQLGKMFKNLSISASFTYDDNEALSLKASNELGDYGYVEVVENIDIVNFAVVLEPGNANSYGLKLSKGVEKMEEIKVEEEIVATEEETKVEEVATEEETKVEEQPAEEEEVKEEEVKEEEEQPAEEEEKSCELDEIKKQLEELSKLVKSKNESIELSVNGMESKQTNSTYETNGFAW